MGVLDSYTSSTLSTDDNDKYKHLHKNRRTRIEKQQYDNMKRIEKQKLALDKLQSDEFEIVLRRYYEGGVSDANNKFTNGKAVKDFTKQELIEKFFQDRIWSEYNTAGIAYDVGNVMMKDDQYKGDWAEITQVYADLPWFGNETIGFAKWAKDFIPALVSDPLNLFTFGAGSTVVREAAKTPLKGLVKKQFVKQASKAAALDIAKKEAIYGGAIAVAADGARQMAEIDSNLMSDYNVTRTLLAGATGGLAQGTIGGAMGYWSAKGKAGKFYDKGDGFKGDLDRDVGLGGKNDDTTWSGKDGKLTKQKPLIRRAPIKVGTKVQADDRANVGTVIEVKGNKAKVEFINKKTKLRATKTFNKENLKSLDKVKITTKPDQTVVIEKKIKEVKRKTPIINLSKISSREDHNIIIKEINNTIKKLTDEGSIRTTERVGLLAQIKDRAMKILDPKNAKELAKELDVISRIAPDLAPNILAGRYNLINKSKEIIEIRKIGNEAVDPKEKFAVAQKLFEALKEKQLLLNNHIKSVEGVSDALQSQKLVVEMTDADRLRLDADIAITKEMPNILARIEKMSPEEQVKAINQFAEFSSNDELLRKFIRQYNRKKKDTRVTLSEALNEYVTGNLLFDPTTHEINILSTIARFQSNIVENYYSGLISFARGEGKLGLNKIRMANDLMLAQTRFFQIAFKKAQLAWKANRSIGDTIEHRFDGRQQRNMETYMTQLRESNSMLKKALSYVASPIGKLSFLSLRGLGAGDTFTKNIFNRAQRVANVNQRMRTFYPELWNKRRKINKTQIVRIEENIRNLKENIRFEKAQDKPNVKKINKLDKQLLNLEGQKVTQTPFEKKWSELYFQYEDEFGNFRQTKTFNRLEVESLDDLTKSVANDPTYTARVSSFTQNLRNEALDPNQFYPDQKQSSNNFGDLLLKLTNQYPLIRVLTGLHFVKTPVSLFKYGWQMTPMLNKLNMEYRAMRNASDPVLRQKAEALSYLGMTVYGMATYYAMNDKITGYKTKDRKHRFSYKYQDENGVDRYVSLSRFFPLSIPFMVTAAIKDSIEDLGDLWDDPAHSIEQNKILEFFTHMASSSFALWSNIFASNLMTQDFFEVMAIFSDTEATNEEGAANVSKVDRYFSRSASKLIPAATGWRWSNKVFGDSEVELMNMIDHLRQSTPYALAKTINDEYLDGQFELLNYGDALSPRRDALGNTYPKPQGLLLGNWQDIFPVTSHWSANIVDRNGKNILTERAKSILQNSNILWERPRFKVEVGTKLDINLKEYNVTKMKSTRVLANNIELREGTTLYEAMLQVKSQILLGGRTLNERIIYELENPNSAYNRKGYLRDNRLYAGKYQGDKYILEIIREYERASREYIMQYAFFEADNGKVSTINGYKETYGKQESQILSQLQ